MEQEQDLKDFFRIPTRLILTVLGGVPRRYNYSQNSYERLCAGAAKARAIRAAKREAGIPETRVERRVGILKARVARLEAKLSAAEREWAKNPKKYADPWRWRQARRTSEKRRDTPRRSGVSSSG
jgi:hypothetical protein